MAREVMDVEEALGLTLDDFLARANSGADARLFDAEEYDHFRAAITACRDLPGQRYYQSWHAGACRGHTTAQWGVWREPGTQEVLAYVGRRLAPGLTVPEARQGGARTYIREWEAEHDQS